MAEQLVAAADGEQGGAVVDRRARAPRACWRPCRRRPCAGRGPGRRRCRRGRGRRGRSRSPGPGAGVGEADPAPLAAPLQEDDVAAVGVDVHLLRVEAEDAQLHQASFSSRTTVEPTWRSVGGDLRGGRPARSPASTRLAPRARRRRGCGCGSRSAPRSARRPGRRSGAGAGSTISSPMSTRRRAAGSSRPSRRPRARPAAAAGLRRRCGHPLDDRERRPARRGAGGRRRSRRHATRSAPSASSCSELHRRQDQGELVLRARSRRASPTTASQRQPARARSRQRREQLRVEVEADTRVPAPGQVQGDPAGAAAEVEHRAAGRGRQLLPERQVGRVGAALDVVPDHRRAGRAHRQNSFARPRSASSLRSSSSAV